MAERDLDEEYRLLLEWRTALRRFLKWSEERAAAEGLTAMQHQLLVAVGGSDDPRGPTIGDVAELLLLRPHSVGELVDRAEAAGLVARRRDPDDHRVVRLAVTPPGARKLARVTEGNREQLVAVSRALSRVVDRYERRAGGSGIDARGEPGR